MKRFAVYVDRFGGRFAVVKLDRMLGRSSVLLECRRRSVAMVAAAVARLVAS